MSGFIAVHRKIFSNSIIKPRRPYSRFEAFLWLLMRANYSENKFELGGEVIKADRGEVITSQKKLQAKFGWGNTKVRNFLKILQSDEMIVLKPTPQLTRISICNYESYQIKQTTDKPEPNRRQTADKPQTNTMNKKNKKNKNNKRTIQEIETIFFNEIFTESNIAKYGKAMLREFNIHYSEPTQDGKQLGFQTFKTWSTAGRLVTWSKNDYKGCFQEHKNQMHEQQKRQKIEDSRNNAETDPEGQAKYIGSITTQLANKLGVK